MSSQFFAPLFIKGFVEALDREGSEKYTRASILIILLFLLLFARALMIVHSKAKFNQCGTILSQVLRSLLIKKMLQLNVVYIKYYSSTIITNLMTTDVDSVINGLRVWPNFLASIIIVSCSIYSLISG